MRQLLAGIKQNNLSHIFCYILWTFSSYSGKVSITFSSSPVRWATFFLIILIIFCCFAGEAILTWSLSNDIDGLPTSLINPFWHLLEQTVILLWSGTHHHQLEKKIEYPFADVKQFQNQLQLQAQSIYVLYWKRRTLFFQDHFVMVWFCFLKPVLLTAMSLWHCTRLFVWAQSSFMLENTLQSK